MKEIDSDVVLLKCDQVSYKIYLPGKDIDYIQKKIYNEMIPYEYEMLQDILGKAKKDAIIVDIGSNIGNHSLYLAAHGFDIYAFEANLELCNILKVSIELNGFRKLKLHEFGLSDKKETAILDNLNAENLGGQSLKIKDSGDIVLYPLDDIKFEKDISVLKIDVEGMEAKVLNGAINTIKKHRPFLYIEAINNIEFRKINVILEKLDYVYWNTFNATPTHLYYPKEQLKDKDILSNISFHKTLESYRMTQSLNYSKKISTEISKIVEITSKNSTELYAKINDLESQKEKWNEIELEQNKKIRQLQLQNDKLEQDLQFHKEKLDVTLVNYEGMSARSEKYRQEIIFKDSEIKRLENTLSYRIGNRIVNAKNIKNVILLPYHLYMEYKSFKLRQKKKNILKQTNKIKKTMANSSNTPKQQFINKFDDIKNIKIACIMDEFTYTSFKYECDLLQLSPGNWKNEVATFKPDLLFIESAWQGKDSLWKLKISGFSTELQELIEYCKENNIATVFWSKEDPVHFNTFLPIACSVDFIFTTDIDCIPKYKFYVGHEDVYCLPFAAQTKIHNPIEEFDRKDEFNFAGSYYLRYPQRQLDFENLIGAVKSYKNISIYDRNFNNPHPHYTFPDCYKDMIIGNLSFNEIIKAYKGYKFGITMNTVKQSQTMFARRAFELIACNTFVVSNFSRALRNFFGDLVISSDDMNELKDKLKLVCEDEIYYKKIKLNALRKVMKEHTYADRLNFIASVVYKEQFESKHKFYILIHVNSQEEYIQALDVFYSQKENQGFQLLIYNDKKLKFQPNDQCIYFSELEELFKYIKNDKQAYFGMMDIKDYYNENYLLDLTLTLKYSNFNAFGKYSFYSFNDGEIYLENKDCEYKKVKQLFITSSFVKVEYINKGLLAAFLNKEFSYQIENMFATDCFNYCKNGISLTKNQQKYVSSIDKVYSGISIKDLNISLNFKGVLKEVYETSDLIKMDAKFIYDNIEKPISSKVKFSFDDKSKFIIESKLSSEAHKYFYFKNSFTRETFNMVKNSQFLLQGIFSNEDFKTVFEFQDENYQKISHSINKSGDIQTLAIPKECKFIRFGLRIQGAGKFQIDNLILDFLNPQPFALLSRSKKLVLTKQYPSYDDLYKYGFLHSRIKAYKEKGVLVDVFRLSNTQRYECREFEDIDVMTASNDVLEETLVSGQYDHVLVHFLDKNMWNVLEKFVDKIKITVWIHGAEIQIWQRREFEFERYSEIEIQRQKKLSDQRVKFWTKIFNANYKNMHFTFVSEYFKNESLSDLRVALKSSQYTIIHNPIDTSMFNYLPKSPNDRKKILSIRPFTSRKYANDLSIEAILELSKREFFKDLEFFIAGDGVLFDELINKLNSFKNIIIHRGFLTQKEISNLHKQYGIFLNPTRMDAQGVSRDEAMSSGLVPITNNIAAIPEFVDSECGILVEPENAKALADAIEFLYKNPDEFMKLSANAAKRVRQQCDKDMIVSKELDIIL
ncbi:FkbM family methyltransferase [Campylobacter lari]|uniref:FkbM family methyltransferase n=1 Tax=Campylobacter lari TaxID=201 RepID=UPI001289ED2D|nr:FkbM family methyltransferase [Campylobacter lari]EAI4483743.1 FkbM family methyltransferase [Campylobacter lari]EAJ9524763.1 FkbM family methyltransferase [Campylobacter lari]EAJ9676175.1 FkbM family methyltransferase [Campylobacter lari]EAK0133701.1 FkbM family methyltransferase [Campylobacter lari]